MQIDRSNYEIWIIDWLDGNLNDIRIEQLQQFLNENPDLKEEFNELITLKLNNSRNTFPYKNHLKKTTADLPDSQFEYLSVAYLENDLSAGQQTELKEIIEQNPEKKLSFDLIQKMKLTPANLLFRHKNKLIRRSGSQRVIRLSLIGLSAAAALILAIITFISKPEVLQIRIENTARTMVVDSTVKKPANESYSPAIKTERKILIYERQTKTLPPTSEPTISVIPETKMNPVLQTESLARSSYAPATLPNKINVPMQIDLKAGTIPNSLIALNFPVPAPGYDDERSRLGKFIAKTFREKILKDKTAKDSPLRIYEIAEAGVSGLDSLLGWQMALSERKDENGDLKSVYFSSKILKFNAPVKKSDRFQ